MAAIARPSLGKLYLAQGLFLALICAGLAMHDVALGYSALLGGLIWIAPNAYFARQVFRFSGARATHHVTRAFYLGEAGKFALTAVTFGVVFAVIEPLHVPALWMAYLGTMALGMALTHRVLVARP